jgi:hypothetical protein
MVVANSNPQGTPKLLTKVVKKIGYLLGPDTPTGKGFVYFEKGLTKAADKIGQSGQFLDFTGGLLNRALKGRALWVAYQESWLRAMGMPTWSEVNAVRDQLRDVQDQLEDMDDKLTDALAALQEERHGKPQSGRRAAGE